MIAAITIDHLLTTVRCNDVGVAYLYCNYKMRADQTTTGLLAAILKQLVHGRPSAAEPVMRLFDQHTTKQTRPSLEEIFNSLQSVLSDYTSTYIVVDALDECTDKEGTCSQLLHRLRSLQPNADVHLMATSRFIPEIEKEFELMPRLEIRASDEDIERFVRGQMHRLAGCVQRNEALQGLVQQKLVEAVDGMLVYCDHSKLH